MKYKILDILYNQGSSYISGQKICTELGISRNAVWKHIRALIDEGYSIKGERGRGYTLDSSADILNEHEIKRNIDTDIPVVYSYSMDSTNNKAKRIAMDIKSEIAIVVCSVQETGRGRLGRTFESANDKGVWCSFILKPGIEPRQALLITIAAAEAVCMTIEELYGIKPGIKWPNDIIIDDRKVCGILSEMNCETNIINYIIAGIGINVSQGKEDFSTETSEIASSLYVLTGLRVSRSKIIARLCYNIREMYECILNAGTGRIMNIWKKYNITDGREITLYKGSERIKAVAIGIDESGNLITKTTDGTINKYNSGEISIREREK